MSVHAIDWSARRTFGVGLPSNSRVGVFELQAYFLSASNDALAGFFATTCANTLRSPSEISTMDIP